MHIKYAYAFIYLSFASQWFWQFCISVSLPRCTFLSLTHFLSEVHSLHANGLSPPPHVYLIKNQLKTPRRRVSRAEPRLRVEQNRFPHSLPLSLPLALSDCLSLSLPAKVSISPPHKLRPPVYWKLPTWFTRTENLIYIFFSSCILSFIY